MKTVEIIEAAEVELQDAMSWYRDRDPRVADRFAEEVRAILRLIAAFPQVGGYVPDIDDSDVRRMPVHGFPYHVVFVRLPDHLKVVAFAHRRKRPAFFVKRLRRL